MAPTTPSLERLKALDDLPSLDVQLDEVHQLCTHGARAEMIAKWLIRKLQSSPEAAQRPKTWESLTLTFRLLPPERLVTVYGSSKILRTLQDVVKYGPISQQGVFEAGTQLVEYLLQQSSSPAGVAIRAGLGLPAHEAAEFVGIWLRQSLSCLDTRRQEARPTGSTGVHMALQLWDLRKRSSDDNEAFSQHCLVPCAALISVRESAVDVLGAEKRKYGRDSAWQSTRASLESLLARHIFLPGRASFFRARATSRTKDVDSQRPSHTIENLLGPLRNANFEANSPIAGAAGETMPQLLDAALRSSPALSPMQRNQEKPWIETLFLAFQNVVQEGDRLADAEPLIGMLSVLARRSCTTTAKPMMDIVEKHAGLRSSAKGNVEWRLVAGVVGVDASLFKDTELAGRVFDAITLASIQLGEDAEETDEDVLSVRSTWKDGIVTPILRAFAKYNDFTTALDLCSRQLMKDLHGTFWSVWHELDRPIQTLLEESLTSAQVTAACSRQCQIITDFNSSRETRDIESLDAAIVMLNAILGGIRNEESIDRLQVDLEEALRALFELHDAFIGPALIPALRERRCWSLMTSIFELCFPKWAADSTNAPALVAKVDAMIPDSVLDRAADISSTAHPLVYGSVEDPRSASDARCFAACVCKHLLECSSRIDDTALGRYVEIVNVLGHDGKPGHASKRSLNTDAFVLYPENLGFMDAPARKAALEVMRANAKGNSTELEIRVLTAIGSGAASLPSPQLLDDLISVALIQATKAFTHSKEGPAQAATLLVDVLLALPVKSMTRPQREKILDQICMWCTEKNVGAAQMLVQCLPLMVELMEYPNPTARICLEPAVLSNISTILDADGTDAAKPSASHVDAVTSLILLQCARTKDQERSKDMLVGVSAEAAGLMKSKERVALPMHIAQNAMLKAVLTELESDRVDELKAQLPHRKPSTVKKLAMRIGNEVQANLQDLDECAVRSLELLGAVPPALMAASGYDIAQLLATLATFLDSYLDDSQAGDSPAVAVSSYQILGRFATTSNIELGMFADRLLRLGLDPQQHAAVLATFDHMVDELGSSRYSLAKELLESDSLPPSRLLLLRRTIKQLDKTDFDGHDGSLPTSLFHRLLRLASSSNDFTVSQRALACIGDVLRAKPFMVNQYNVEMSLHVLQKLVQRGGPGKSMLYLDVCSTLGALLLHHRSRLQGRFHMLVKLLQALLTPLFEPLPGWDAATARRPPTAKHAHALSRLLKLFCEPPQLRRAPAGPGLVDESRREQAHVGTFVQHVLHHYCAQILRGTLGEGMKEALTPGLRAMIEAMEMHGAEGGKALSAAMGSGERAVLRGLYEEWRRFGKWRGG